MTTPVVHIYVCHHKSGFAVSDDVFKPIQVGAALSKYSLSMASDAEGDSISHKNKEYCELTAMYWAWKNDAKANWIGLAHYRRYMAFSPLRLSADVYGCVNFDKLDATTAFQTGLDSEAVLRHIKNKPSLKAILPTPWSVKNIGFESLNEHYAKADYHYAKDLITARQVLSEIYPFHVDFFDRVMQSDLGYFTNVFVLRRDLYDAYCEWLFSILFEVEKRTDLTNYSVAGRRVYGYLAERLFNVYVASLNLKSDEKFELTRTFFNKTDAIGTEVDFPPPSNNCITLVIASDDNFVPHLAALIESIKDTTTETRELQIFVLDGGILAKNKGLLQKQFQLNLKHQGSLYFVDCAHLYKDVGVHMHFSTSTFYRIDIGNILPQHRKAIYIDCDTIVQCDLAQLWDLDLDGFAVAAAPDLIMKNFVKNRTPAMKEASGQPAGDYLQNYLKLGQRTDDYFQAGIIVFDLERYRNLKISGAALNELKNKKYWFLDQDVLNKYLVGHVKFLDTSWNCVNMTMDVLGGLNAEWAAKAAEDFNAPKVVHYAGFEAKPWNNPRAPWSEIYWHYLRRTYWYEIVALRFPPTSDTGHLIHKGPSYRFMRAVWRSLPNPLKVQLTGAMHRFNHWYFKL